MTRTRTARHPRPCAYFETWAHLSDHVHCPEEDQRAAVDEYTEHLSAQVAALTTQREA